MLALYALLCALSSPPAMLDLDSEEEVVKGHVDEYYGGMDKNLKPLVTTAVWDAGYDGNVGE